jgi:hypothetical protein
MVRILTLFGFCAITLMMAIYGTVTYGGARTLLGGLMILGVCGADIRQYWLMAVKKQYVTLIGTLESMQPYGYRRQKTELMIRMKNGVLVQLVTEGRVNMRTGKRYVFYFHQLPPEATVTSNMLNRRFIDFEEMIEDDVA